MNTLKWVLALAALGAALAVEATDVIVLADPTRPPAALRRPAPMSSQRGEAAAPAASAPAEPVAAPPRLSSIRLARGGEDSAIVDGRLVSVGDRVGDASITAIDKDGVLLRTPVGTQRLSLTPTVNKTAPGVVTPALRGGKERP